MRQFEVKFYADMLYTVKDIYNHHEDIWYDIIKLLEDIEINQVVIFSLGKLFVFSYKKL